MTHLPPTRVHDSRRRGRRPSLAGITAALCLATLRAHAACIGLPDRDLDGLDDAASREPDRAISIASARIAELGPHAGALRLAELHAILAEAHFNQSHDPDTVRESELGLALLAPQPAGPSVDRVRIRLAMRRAVSHFAGGDSAQLLAALDPLVAAAHPDTPEYSCVLAERSVVHVDRGELEQAAGDGVTAYRVADRGGWAEARATAAYGLANLYRDSGLLADAAERIRDVVDYAALHHQIRLTAIATYVQGRVWADLHRFDDARASFEASRAAADAIGDRFGVAGASTGLCYVRTETQDFERADRDCDVADAYFRNSEAPDFRILLALYRAHLELARCEPKAALAAIDRAFSIGEAWLPLAMRPQLYEERGHALLGLHRDREAATSFEQAFDLSRRADVESRGRAISVLTAATASEKLALAQQAFRERSWRLETEVGRRTLVQGVWTVGTAAALALASALAYALHRSRRHKLEVEQRELILSTLSTHAPDALMLLQPDRTVLFANRALFNDGAAAAPGRPIRRLLPDDAIETVNRLLSDVEASHEPAMESLTVVGADGSPRHFELRVAPIVVGERFVGTTLRATDVTDVRELEREVVEGSRREQQRLSSDLHEGVGQELTGLSLLVAGLSNGLQRGQPVDEAMLRELQVSLKRSLEMTRNLARGLSPVHVEMGSLGAALGRLANEAGARLQLEISAVATPPDAVVEAGAADHLYRIAYEAITNAARHAGCRRIHVELDTEGDQLMLSITDDGRGFDPDAVGEHGLGLRMMRYRARLLGGSLRFERPAQGGTRVVFVATSSLLASPAAAASG